MAENNEPHWRALCAAAAEEPDSEKVAWLVDQILEALDEPSGLWQNYEKCLSSDEVSGTNKDGAIGRTVGQVSRQMREAPIIR